MDIKIYKDSITSYVFLFGFLITAQNETTLQIENIEQNINKDEPILVEQQENINIESNFIVDAQEKNKKEDSWFFVLQHFYIEKKYTII